MGQAAARPAGKITDLSGLDPAPGLDRDGCAYDDRHRPNRHPRRCSASGTLDRSSLGWTRSWTTSCGNRSALAAATDGWPVE